ncbi:MAG TPA: GNAT family N-acetyltransferase [Thermomicrobiales bacterium]|nr:GNAT family N-acetyltransferase [Thermomicrobiales bacterium]
MSTEPPADRPVLATYLQLPGPDAFRPATIDDADLLLMDAREPLAGFYRFLYDAVGRGFSWVDRLRWSDADLEAHLARPEVTLMVLYVRGTPAGYVELDAASDEPGTEIRHLGIIPAFHGRGLGKHLLSRAVERAFRDGAERVWLSTRSTDGPHAIANYAARGFVTYRTDWEPAPMPVEV